MNSIFSTLQMFGTSTIGQIARYYGFQGLFPSKINSYYMWQSHVEIECYSVAYFDRIAVFERPYC